MAEILPFRQKPLADIWTETAIAILKWQRDVLPCFYGVEPHRAEIIQFPQKQKLLEQKR